MSTEGPGLLVGTLSGLDSLHPSVPSAEPRHWVGPELRVRPGRSSPGQQPDVTMLRAGAPRHRVEQGGGEKPTQPSAGQATKTCCHRATGY